jgi:hypothetical protein
MDVERGDMIGKLPMACSIEEEIARIEAAMVKQTPWFKQSFGKRLSGQCPPLSRCYGNIR